MSEYKTSELLLKLANDCTEYNELGHGNFFLCHKASDYKSETLLTKVLDELVYDFIGDTSRAVPFCSLLPIDILATKRVPYAMNEYRIMFCLFAALYYQDLGD